MRNLHGSDWLQTRIRPEMGQQQTLAPSWHAVGIANDLIAHVMV